MIIYPHVCEELNGASLQFQIWIIIDSNLTKTIIWDAILLMEHENYELSDAGTGGARGATGPPNIWQIS